MQYDAKVSVFIVAFPRSFRHRLCDDSASMGRWLFVLAAIPETDWRLDRFELEILRLKHECCIFKIATNALHKCITVQLSLCINELRLISWLCILATCCNECVLENISQAVMFGSLAPLPVPTFLTDSAKLDRTALGARQLKRLEKLIPDFKGSPESS